MGSRRVGARWVEAPMDGARWVGGSEGRKPKCSRLFFPSPAQHSMFFSLHCGLLVEFGWLFWGGFAVQGGSRNTFGVLWVILSEPRRPGLVGRRGFPSVEGRSARRRSGEKRRKKQKKRNPPPKNKYRKHNGETIEKTFKHEEKDGKT